MTRSEIEQIVSAVLRGAGATDVQTPLLPGVFAYTVTAPGTVKTLATLVAEALDTVYHTR